MFGVCGGQIVVRGVWWTDWCVCGGGGLIGVSGVWWTDWC